MFGLGIGVVSGLDLLVPGSRPAALCGLLIGLKALVPLNRTLARPYTTRSVIYRVTLRGDNDAASAFVSDAHQDAKLIDRETVAGAVRFAPRADSS